MIGLGLSITQLAVRQLLGEFSPLSLFSAGEQGVWYDPSDFSTMFQDLAGTVPVTAVEQPVGRILDKSGRGNHATQSTAINRPVLSARYNLVESTEDPTTTAWSKGRTAAIKNIADPDGANTAFSVYETTDTGSHFCSQSIVTPTGVSTRRVVYLKYAGVKFVAVTANQDLLDRGICVDIESGVISSVGTTVTSSSISAYKDGWYRVEFITNAGGQISIQIVLRRSSGTTTESYTGDPTKGVLIWRPDTRASNDGIGLPAYQRVNTATDYDTAGFPLYLRFNGTNSWMQTASINFTSTDKMTVWAGVRKLSDSTAGLFVELSADVAANVGAFALFAPSISGSYRFFSRATGVVQPAGSVVFASAPDTSAVTGIADIAAPIVRIRRNGGVVETNTVAQGTGNYGNYPLYIGSRAGSSFWFNGRLYSLIVRGAQSTNAQITSAEAYVNTKTKAY